MIVIYHANCADGFCAAWVVRKKHPEAVFYAMNHGDNVSPELYQQLIGQHLMIVDFSFPRVQMEILWNHTCGKLVCLDHHKTAQGLPYINHSGARLTWDYLFTGPRPWLVDYTEDRDMWWWALPQSKEVSAGLASYPFDFGLWDQLELAGWEQLAVEGSAILRYQEQVIQRAIANATETSIDYKMVPVVNCSNLISETCGRLAEGKPFAASYFVNKNGEYVYSLRSAKDGLDVSTIAQRFGGGGHKHAAGFTVKERL